jgi:hypothetical protein
MSNLRVPYQNFFLKSEEGKACLDEIRRMITANHEQAEKKPELSRDHSQRAKGNREVLDHILSVVTDIKKGTAPKS